MSFALLLCACGRFTRPGTQGVLTSLGDIRKLPEKTSSMPFQLRATTTFVDPTLQQFFIQDDTGAARVIGAPPQADLRPAALLKFSAGSSRAVTRPKLRSIRQFPSKMNLLFNPSGQPSRILRPENFNTGWSRLRAR